MEEAREAGFKQKAVLVRTEALALESERPKFKFVLLCCQIGDGFLLLPEGIMIRATVTTAS